MKVKRKEISAGMKKFLSGIIAFTLVLNMTPLNLVEDFVSDEISISASAANKDSVPAGTVFSEEQARVATYYDADEGYYSLSDINRILDYSRAYYSYPEDHQDDVINLTFGQGESAGPIYDFIAIGTEECPFNGKVLITSSAYSSYWLPEAFFDYVYDSVEVLDTASGDNATLSFERIMNDSGEPVFARHVWHNNDSDTVTWKVKIEPYEGNNYNFGGFIGELDDEAKIILEVEDTTSASIYGKDDIGYICGKMGKSSSLTVESISRSDTSYSVETTVGNAGGVVGRMLEGSELILKTSMPNPSASITAAGSGKYAGGIVGYNDGGTVTIGVDSSDEPIFSANSKYSIQNTLVGVDGAGGVFGYYRPSFSSNEKAIDISWLKIGTSASSRMTANGKGSVGGLFGVLENKIASTGGNTTTYSSGKIVVTDSSDNSAVLYFDHDGVTNNSVNNDVINYGGLIGKYSACDLGGSLEISDISVNVARSGSSSYENYGGGIGITTGGNGNDKNSLYVKFDDYNVTVASGNGTATSVYGGLVAKSTNAFIDANNVTCNSTGNFYGGGVIGQMENGVLRLSGTTDLTGGYAQISTNNFYNEGQIVGGRDSSLVFAENGWVLKRSTACSVDDIGSWGEVLRFSGIDTATENTTKEQYGTGTVLTVNETAHTVTIGKPATETTIGSIADFAMLSLCFQLKGDTGLPWQFDSDWIYNYSTIINQNIKLDATFSLAGTGLTGLTRDNAIVNTDFCVYKGKFDGNSNTLTLATGEAYGDRGNTSLTSHSAEGNGRIYRHVYTGLFGIIDGTYDSSSNYTVKDLTLSGTVDISAQVGAKIGDKLYAFYCGGFASRSLKDFTANNVGTKAVTTSGGTTTGFRMTHAGSKLLYMGGLVGEMGSEANTIAVKSSTFAGNITGSNGGNADGDEKGNTCIGGVIGRISHNTDEAREWDFTSVTLKGTISNTNDKAAQRIGGLVAEISGSYNGYSSSRRLTLNGVTANGLKLSGTLAADGSMGGLLGYSWLKTDVDVTSVTVNNTAEVNMGTAEGNTAGIVYRATGHWTVTALDIQSLKMTATNAKSVGAIINKGYFYTSGTNITFYNAENRSAVYLELPANYTYNLVFNGESINSSAVFDELCAYTCPSSSDIMNNGNGIISVNTKLKVNSTDTVNVLYTDGTTASGSYHAQTSYGAKPNPNARYYYNLDTVTNNTASNLSTPQMKLMSWGVNRYACENLKKHFADPFSNGTITDGTYDMTGYSWYPVDLDSGITVNGTFTFYNKEFEDSEALKYTAENSADSTKAYKRTSLYDSTNSSNTQHYLMHNGLFHNVNSCTLTIGNVTLSGDVAGYATSTSGNKASVCGALVCGTVSGSSSSKVGTVKMASSGTIGISLAGVSIYNIDTAHGNAIAVSEYAPLLINRFDSHSVLNISNVSTTEAYNYDSDSDNTKDKSHIVATSLIGDVGNISATDVNIEFKKMKLDGRNNTGAADTNLSDTAKGNFNSMYNTFNSIFSKATFLNSFSYNTGSSGRYNFTWAEDWDVDENETADTTHNGNVTYGKELGYDSTKYPKTGSGGVIVYNSQYPDEEFLYSESTTNYTNPITPNDTVSSGNHSYATGFIDNFIPYVAERYNTTDKTYQLQVNHGKNAAEGCGTYDDPYIIWNGNDIENFSRWINTDAQSAKIYIPTGNLKYDPNNANKIIAITSTQCGSAHVECEFSDGYFRCTINGTVCIFEESVMRTYLAGAYYQIHKDAPLNDLVIDDDFFEGFGANDITDGTDGNYPYRFRGVFDGNNKTIVNKTTAPFIYYSNGSVVKNLTISVQPTSDIILAGCSKSFDKMWTPNAVGNAAYGAVIARIIGGDNIIDNVSVDYSSMGNNRFDLRAKYAPYVPFGGYIGVIVNGGVVFRNMSTAATAYIGSGLKNNNITATPKQDYKPGSTTFSKDNNNNSPVDKMLDSNAWLYVNPYIGRVINGYAVNESSAYHPYETGERKFGDNSKETDTAVTLKNGSKHYSITDIDTSDTIGIDENTVTVSGGQDLFLMSLMVNSGMSHKALGYNQAYQMSRSATYENVGTTQGTDYSTNAVNDVLDSSTHKSSQFGYLVQNYFPSLTTGKLENNGDLIIELSDDVILPDGFKGIGNLFANNDNYRMKVNTFNGNGHTISQNTSYLYYIGDITAYIPQKGLGLLNYVSSIGTYNNMYLTGMVKTDLINTDNGNYVTSISPSSLENDKYLCAGTLIGTAGAGSTINNLALTNIDVKGIRNTGGLIGYETSGTLLYTIDREVAANAYNSDKIKVHGRASTGGMLGKLNAGTVNTNTCFIKVNMNNHTFNLSEVICDNTNARGGNYWDYGVGGFVGMIRSANVRNENLEANYFYNIIIGTEDKAQTVKCEGTDIFTAGVVGIMNKCNGISIDNCTFYNLSVTAKFGAAGLVAFPTTWTPAKVTNTHLYSPKGSTIESKTDFAGGLIGSSDPREEETNGSQTFTFDTCSVSGYTISGKLGAGGVIGFRGAAGNHPLYLKNTEIANCTIKSDGALGGVIGEMNNSVAGYNILAKDVDFDTFTELEDGQNPPESYKAGYICGHINTKSENCTYSNDTKARTGTAPTIKFAGFSRQSENKPMLDEVVGANNAGGNYGTGGYVIFADYNGTASDEIRQNKAFSNIADGVTGYPENASDPIAIGSRTTVTDYTVIAQHDGSGNVTVSKIVSSTEVSSSESDQPDPIAKPGVPNTSASGTRTRYVVSDAAMTQISSPDELTSNDNAGFYMYTDKSNGRYFKNVIAVVVSGKGRVITYTANTSDPQIAVWHFEKIGNQYYVYTTINNEVKYLAHEIDGSNVAPAWVSKSDATAFYIELNNNYALIYYMSGNTKMALGHSGTASGMRFHSDNYTNGNGNIKIYKIPANQKLVTETYTDDSFEPIEGTQMTGTSSNQTAATSTQVSEYNTMLSDNSFDNTNKNYEVFTLRQTVIENIYDEDNWPYVITSPKNMVSASQFLTSDGVGYGASITYENSTIGDILSDTSSKKYSKTGVNNTAKEALVNKLDTLGKYASYKKQMGSKAGTSKDFPVLVIDEATDTSVTTLINNYLRYLTNSDFDFAAQKYSDQASASNVFEVQLGACVWDDDSFTYHLGSYNSTSNTDGAFLYLNKANSKFSISNGSDKILYDNEVGERFTLIDVQFKDPCEETPTKIAYHLYVPVLVKKMLYYDFHVSLLSGTNYRIAPYEEKRGNTLIENIDNPVTMEIQWTYDRNLAGWQAALEAGDDLYHTSFDRRLKVLNHQNGIPEGTKMVLVDANDMNKYYRAEQGGEGLWTQQTGSFYSFDLSAFGYTPPKLNDYFTVGVSYATEDTIVKFSKTTDDSKAIISDGTDKYMIDEEGEYELTLSYKDTVTTTGDSGGIKNGKIQDDYYITFFTDSEYATKTLYHLEFYDWGDFGSDTYPTLVADNDHSHFLIGDIFVNENFTITELNPKTEMSLVAGAEYNDTIQATYNVDVGVKESIKNDIKTYFGMSSVEVYQSFLIKLNRQTTDSSLQGIATRPSLITVSDFMIRHLASPENENYTVDYTVDTDGLLTPSNDDNMENPDDLTTSNYIELRDNVNLRTYMRTACSSTGLKYNITAKFELSYTDEEKMAAQFPTRDSSNLSNPNIGTLIGGSSSISSTKESAANSKTTTSIVGDWVTNYPYYCTINTNAILTLNSDDAANVNGEFYQLGINALDLDQELTEDGYVPMKLNAIYDVSDLSAAGEAESMKLIITVSKKSHYGTAINISEFIDDLKLYSYNSVEDKFTVITDGTDTSIDTTNSYKIVYTVVDPDTVFKYDDSNMTYEIPITFNAIIGDAFGNSKEYSNYMIKLEIEMFKDAAATEVKKIDGSKDDDHVIYSHAKIFTGVIE